VITLQALGWDDLLEDRFHPFREKGLEPGRIAVEDKHHYVLITPQGELTGQVAGKMLHRAGTAADLPKVGDWVAFSKLPDEAKGVIQHVLPRATKLSRKTPGRETEEQVLATNIDMAFIVQGFDRPLNCGLLHRHLAMVLESGAKPLIVLNKADLAEDAGQRVREAEQVAQGVRVVALSAKTGQGVDLLRECIRPGQTIVLIGSSGVGKSTLINALCGEEVQPTAEVRESDAKGRHTTSWRELVLLPDGGLVIDTPGMRELQMWMANEGMREGFSDLDALAVGCRFRDCAHTVEKGCAVLEAVANGRLARERYEGYLKLKRELAYLEEAQIKHAWLRRKRGARRPTRV
jgi:ribosome biogenesis GTPase